MYQYFFAKPSTRPKRLLSGCLLLAALGAFNPAQAACESMNASLAPVIDGYFNKPASFDWQGEFLQDDGLCFPSRQSGAELRAYLLAPADIESRADGSLPLVVIGPGSGNGQALYYLWSARELAGHGYVVLVEDPQGAGRSEINGSCGAGGCPGVPYQNVVNYIDGIESALDYVFTREHPWLKKADLARVGLAGHSLSASAVSYVGSADERVKAVVAWDTLVSDQYGDAGVPSGNMACGALIYGSPPGISVPITPRVPSLGQASDGAQTCNPVTDAEAKKTGYEKWRAAGVPSMLVVIGGTNHFQWGQSQTSNAAILQLFEHYTRAWFDLYLNRDESARARLLAREVLDLPLDQQLSSTYRSAAFMPEAGIDCADFVAGCETKSAARASAMPTAASSQAGRGLLLGALPTLTLPLFAVLALLRRILHRNSRR